MPRKSTVNIDELGPRISGVGIPVVPDQRLPTTATNMADEDISVNLPSLRFEAALAPQEKYGLELTER